MTRNGSAKRRARDRKRETNLKAARWGQPQAGGHITSNMIGSWEREHGRTEGGEVGVREKEAVVEEV